MTQSTSGTLLKLSDESLLLKVAARYQRLVRSFPALKLEMTKRRTQANLCFPAASQRSDAELNTALNIQGNRFGPLA